MTAPARTEPAEPLLRPAAVAFVLLFVVSLVAGAALTDGMLPTPASADGDWVAYLAANEGPVRTVALMQLLSAAALAAFTAAAAPLAHRRALATVGGTLSVALLAASGLTQWVMARPEVHAQGPLAHAFGDLAFVLGGPGHTVFLGLLIAALATAVTPRWLSGLGLVIAAIALLSSLSVASYDLSFLIPLGRFPGYLWLLATAFTLPRRR